MTTFIYKILGTEPYLTSIMAGQADVLEIRIADTDSALMRIGNVAVKTCEGVGRVKLSTLGEGVFTPEVIFKDKTVVLYPIRHTAGKISLACPEQISAFLGARAYDLEKRVSLAEEELQRLKDAIYGKAIF